MLEPVDRIDELALRTADDPRCDLLLCSRSPVEVLPRVAPGQQWLPLGLDFGNVETATYSLVVQEVVVGRYAEMRAHIERLNRFMLFDSEADLRAMLQTRPALLERGADLETFGGERWHPWWVYALGR